MLLIIPTIPLTALPHSPETQEYTITFHPTDFTITTHNNLTSITLPNSGITTTPNHPQLPIKNIYLALPNEHTIKELTLTDTTTTTLPRTYTIPTTQPAQPTTTQQTTPPTQPATTPQENQITFIRTFDLAGQTIAQLQINPLTYNQQTHTLNLTTSLTFTIQTTEQETTHDYLPPNLKPQYQTMYETQLKNLVINPEDIHLRTNPRQTTSLPPATYDYVIITSPTYETNWQPLTQWKTQKGIPATIITTDYIYNQGGYNGTYQHKIRSFIQDAHTTWGTMFFLLGGDTGIVPFYIVNITGDLIPSDTYYSDYDDDYLSEVAVGRAPTYNTQTIQNFINKILTYEQNPPPTDYATTTSLYGFDLSATTYGELCKTDIQNLYIPTTWNVTTVYDSQPGNHKTDVINQTNNGPHLINHIDHGNQQALGTGIINHGLSLSNNDVDAFTNGNNLGILYSIACWTCAYDVDLCIGEHYIHNPNGGGIAYIGNARNGFFYYGQTDYASMRYDRYFFQSLFQQNHTTLGLLFTDHKDDAYASMTTNDINQYIYKGLTLLGDPTLIVWTQDPQPLTVTHPTILPFINTSITIYVQSNNTPLADAQICLYKEPDIYIITTTNTTGQATIPITPITPGELIITVTKHNYLPYQNTITINAVPYTPHSPTPSDGATNVNINTLLSWTGGDPDPTDLITYDLYFGTTNPPPQIATNLTTTSYDPGTLTSLTTYYWQIKAKDTYGEEAISPIWRFTTENHTNTPPDAPTIVGFTIGNPGKPYDYHFQSHDTDQDDLMFFIDWGDNTSSGWIGPYPSDTQFTQQHRWNIKGTYIIKAKAKDPSGAESDWGTLTIRMPHSYSFFWNWLQYRFPILYSILQIFLQ